MQIETERLILHPIDDREMEALIARESDPELRQAYGEMLQGCRREPEKRLWYALWLIELKSEPGAVVGDLCFKGLNPNGDLELGYGLREGCCGRKDPWSEAPPCPPAAQNDQDPGGEG